MRLQKKINYLNTKLKRNGIIWLLKQILLFRHKHPENDDFDKINNVDTVGEVPLLKLTIDSQNANYGIGYRPSPADVLEKAIREIPIRYDDYTFVDLGAGKGRPLLIALRFPFKKVIGVEFAEELVRTARQNLIAWHDRAEVVHCDATLYEYPVGNLVIYMYNPFERPILATVMTRLAEAAKSRTIYLVYLQLEDPDIVEKYATPITPEEWIQIFKIN